jgi:hypothetical protein
VIERFVSEVTFILVYVHLTLFFLLLLFIYFFFFKEDNDTIYSLIDGTVCQED